MTYEERKIFVTHEILHSMVRTSNCCNIDERINLIANDLQTLVSSRNLYNFKVNVENGVVRVYYQLNKAMEIYEFFDIKTMRMKKLKRILYVSNQ